MTNSRTPKAIPTHIIFRWWASCAACSSNRCWYSSIVRSICTLWRLSEIVIILFSFSCAPSIFLCAMSYCSKENRILSLGQLSFISCAFKYHRWDCSSSPPFIYPCQIVASDSRYLHHQRLLQILFCLFIPPDYHIIVAYVWKKSGWMFSPTTFL